MTRHLRPATFLTPALLAAAFPAGASVRFLGTAADRIEIPLVHPPGAAAAVTPEGGDDFTVELWVQGLLVENARADAPVAPGATLLACDGGEASGVDCAIGLAAGRIRFELARDAAATFTIEGSIPVLDGDWHHVAVQGGAAESGRLEVWVDGALDASGPGRRGAAAELTDRGRANGTGMWSVTGGGASAGGDFPFRGWLGEVRISRGRRYGAPFVRPGGPFHPDSLTAALATLDADERDRPGAGTEWSTRSPFDGSDGRSLPGAGEFALEAYPNPGLGQTLLWVRCGDAREGDVAVEIRDARGRAAAHLAATLHHGVAMLVWTGPDGPDRGTDAGVYFARVVGDAGDGTRIVIP